MSYDPQRHHRRSIRLKGYDYSQQGLYFITLCCQNRACLFGEVKDGQMILNDAGKIAEEEWMKTPQIRQNTELGEFVVMPNHFHAILEIKYPVEGVLQYAPTELPYTPMGESQFAPTGLQFAQFKSPSQTIGAIIRGFKGATTKRIKELINREGNISDKENNRDRTGVSRYALDKGELQFAPTIAPTIIPPPAIWQRNYWEHIIRNQQEYERIANYIIRNPKKWEADRLNKSS